jgi:hypothetical protein
LPVRRQGSRLNRTGSRDENMPAIIPACFARSMLASEIYI